MGLKEWKVTFEMLDEMTQEHSETVVLHKDAQLNQKQLAEAASSSDSANVKVEFPEYLEMENQKKILSSADTVLNGQLKTARPLVARLKLAGHDTGLQQAFDVCSKALGEIADMCAMAEAAEKSSVDEVIKLTQEMKKHVEHCSTIQDAMKLAIKKAKAKLD